MMEFLSAGMYDRSVLAGLGSEDDGADALDLHGGGVPELEGTSPQSCRR